MKSNEIKALSQKYKEKLISHRRHLHQNPELSFQEYNTCLWIREKLCQLGVPMVENISGNSTAGYLEGNSPGPVIAFRADIDALAVEEENDLPFKSQNPGVMHACGHDAHTAILMGLVEFFSEHRDLIKGKIVFLFQQGEEMVPGGAKLLVEDGVMADVDKIFALHIKDDLPVGSIATKGGVLSGAIGTYKLEITGKGGHTSMLHVVNDPLLTASEIAQEIYRIVPLSIDPMENLTIAVTFLQGGVDGVYNVIPEKAQLGGSIRCMGTALRDRTYSLIEKVASDICGKRNCTYKISSQIGYPSVDNDPRAVSCVIKAVEGLDYQILEAEPMLGGEDFAHYQMEKPGAFFWLGAAPENHGTKSLLHNGKMCIDENALLIGLEVMITTYLETIDEK